MTTVTKYRWNTSEGYWERLEENGAWQKAYWLHRASLAEGRTRIAGNDAATEVPFDG